MRGSDSDAVSTLRWGLKKYWLVIVLCLLAGAALTPLWMASRTTSVDATAVVIAQRVQTNPIVLPRYGEAIFADGRVARAVTAKYGDLGDPAGVVPNRVSLVANQSSIVFQVIGHDPNPQTAAGIANAAADAFVPALNSGGIGVGVFAVQSPATPPAASKPLSSSIGIALGIGGGLLIGLALVSILVVVRRPVITAADAEELTAVPALGTVTVPRTRSRRFPPPETFPGLAPVCAQLLDLETPTVVLVSRRGDAPLRRQVAVAIARASTRLRPVRFVGPEPMQDAVAQVENVPGHGAPLTIVDSSNPLDLVQPSRSTATVLVVREGISGAAIRAAVVQHLGGSAEARLLLVRHGRGARRERGDMDAPATGLRDVLPPEPVTVGAANPAVAPRQRDETSNPDAQERLDGRRQE